MMKVIRSLSLVRLTLQGHAGNGGAYPKLIVIVLYEHLYLGRTLIKVGRVSDYKNQPFLKIKPAELLSAFYIYSSAADF